MKLDIEPGKYVVAVSGGVDSVALLHALYSQLATPASQLLVAHYDHDIRSASDLDRKFVEKLAKDYGLKFFYEEGNLGAAASEALARRKRYEFLNRIKDEQKADGMITAHHQDDVIETAIINIIRGTGRKGLSSLSSSKEIKRPLLKYKKSQIINYARENNLAWKEDVSNENQKYLRNYVRHSILPQLNDRQKDLLANSTKNARELNKRIDELLEEITAKVISGDQIKRSELIALPHDLSKELLAHWLRTKNISFDSRTIERLVVFCKVAAHNTQTDINKKYKLKADKKYISLISVL